MENFLPKNCFVAAICMLAVAPCGAAFAQEDREVLFEGTGDYASAKVEQYKTVCSLLYIKGYQGFNFDIGKTVVTSQLALFSATDFGSNGGDLSLQLVTKERDGPRTAEFGKSNLPQGYKRYSTSLGNLQIDLDDLERTFAFKLVDSAKPDAVLTVNFSDKLRDNALGALKSCVGNLETHWAAD